MTTCVYRGALAALALLATGCGDASAPHQTSTAGSALARHMDSLVVAAKSNPRDSLWAAYLGSAEAVPAYGGTPTSVVVTTRSGTQTWQGFILEGLSQSPDTAYVLWAYSDDAFTDLLTALLVVMPHGVTLPTVYLIANDTVVVSGFGGMAAAATSVGDACSFTSGLQIIPNPPAAGSCQLGAFTATLKVSFRGAIGPIAALDTLAIGPQSLNGVVLK